MYDYSRWPNFSENELICSASGYENPNVGAFTELMDNVQLLRDYLGFPFQVNSAYRSELHPIEAAKIIAGKRAGLHNYAAIDIYVPIEYCYDFIAAAIQFGFTGIGVNLKGDLKGRFIHLDRRTSPSRVWSY